MMLLVLDMAVEPDPLSEGAQILIQLVTTIGLVIVAGFSALGVIMGITRGHAKAARDQVQNDHPQNFRDDMDGKFKALGTDLGGIRSELRSIRNEALEDRARVTDHIQASTTQKD
jgi:hypothetical protein